MRNLVLAGMLLSSLATGLAQAVHRTRLILKDGTYQLVTSYKVIGDRVRFQSAERNGEQEEIPLALIDLDATRKWEKFHSGGPVAGAGGEATAAAVPVVLDPELVAEEAEKAAATPVVATVGEALLRLDPVDSVLGLDTFHGGPELVPMVQQQSDLNKVTGHGILRGVLKPGASAHQIVLLKGEKADVQMHVNRPEIFVRVGEPAATGGSALTVDTHGASGYSKEKDKSAASEYVVVRVEVRQDARVVASFDAGALGTKRLQDVVETEQTLLPGGRWMKVVPKEDLLFGEYCLVELLSDREINLGVWDFGVHPTAGENRDVLVPVRKRVGALERRRP